MRVFSSRKEQQQQQQQQNLSVRARVVYTARSVFVFFVCFLNERQKANEDAFTGPFPYEEGVFEEKNKPTTKTFSSRTTKKREPLLSRRRRARAWVLFIIAGKVWVAFSSLLCLLRVFKRERKGKEYNAETSVPFFPTRKRRTQNLIGCSRF